MSNRTQARNPAKLGARPGTNGNGNGASAAEAGQAIEMTLGEILDLYNDGIGNLEMGKAGLNGYNKAVGDRIMLQPFSLTDEVRQKITHAKFILRPFFTEIDKAERARITCEVMDDPDALHVPPDDHARQALWHHKYGKALEAKHTVHGLHVFKREDFFRDNKNPIPNVTEIALYPITEGSPWRVYQANHGQATAAAGDRTPNDPPGGEG